MTTREPVAHSLVEIHLAAAMNVCRACFGRGHVIDSFGVEADADRAVLLASVSCCSCGAASIFRCDVSDCADDQLTPAAVQRIPFRINAAPAPSALIDVAEWLTLYRMAIDAADVMADRRWIRAVRIEAAQCLAEALKHYEPGNDVPPASAFFAASSVERFRERPEQFARQRLIDLAAGLPTLTDVAFTPIDANRAPDTKWWLP